MKKRYFIISGLMLFLFILLLILLATVDVKAIGAGGTKVGLGFINEQINASYNKAWDVVSDLCMYLSIGLIVVFIVIGIIELIKRKSFKNVDMEIWLLGIGVVVMGIVWLFFDKALIINNRPILVDGKIECSFPSTHVLIVSFITLSSSWILSKKIDNKYLTILAYAFSTILIILTFLGRILSGMHFLTDAYAGLLVGLFLFFAVISFFQLFQKKNN